MPVLNFSYAKIKDPEAFQDYIKLAANLMKEMDVEVVVRGEYATTKRGRDDTPHIAAVFRFVDMDAANAFYASSRYQEIIPLRDRACDMTIRFYLE